MTSALRLAGVSVRLADADILHEIDLALDARTVAVIGDNGSGKSTLARLIGGLVRPTRGHVEVFGLDAVTDAAALRRRVAIVFSNPDAQIIMPTVSEDVAFSLRADRLPRADRDARVVGALERFGLADLADRPAYELSGGQKQLLALCGAFIRQPDLVIADEPTAFLDGRNAHLVSGHLLADTGHRLLVVTHDLALAARCDVAVRMHEGRVVQVGEATGVVDAHAASWRC